MSLLKRSFYYLLSLSATGLLISFIYYGASTPNIPLNDTLMNGTFFVNLPFFLYALLALVTERGLFNGIRYAMKQVQANLFKNKRFLLMEENNIESPSELEDFLKEKYLYQRPKFNSTYPLLISTLTLFLIHLSIAALFY